MFNILSEDDIRKVAPSVFATRPWHQTSENYRFMPTIDVLREATKQGFAVVQAGQKKCRVEGKKEFTKHILRLRHQNADNHQFAGDLIPEILLQNSHDRTSAYVVTAGIFRMVCANGLVVCSSVFDEIRVRHSGSKNIVHEVIEGTFKVLENMPTIMNQVHDFTKTNLAPSQQEEFANQAVELRGTTMKIAASDILHAVRDSDLGNKDGSRDLWKTMNVVQEKLIRADGVQGFGTNGRSRKLRFIASVDANVKLNKAIWDLAEKTHQKLAA